MSPFPPRHPVVLVHNAHSGAGETTAEELIGMVRAAGYEPRHVGLREACAHPEVLDTGEFVIVAGGDGSIRAVADGLVGRDRPLAPLPMGTANNIAEAVGVRGEAKDIIAGWRDGQRRCVDVGTAHGPWGEKFFLEGLGVGLFARAMLVLDELDQVSGVEFSSPRDKLYRDRSVLYALAGALRPTSVRVSLDGRDLSGDFLMIEVLNIGGLGPRVNLAPTADPGDGRLEVVLVRAADRGRLQEGLRKHFSELAAGLSLETHQARSLRLEVDAADVRIDDAVVWHRKRGPGSGESKTTGPAVFDVALRPGTIEFLVPAMRD